MSYSLKRNKKQQKKSSLMTSEKGVIEFSWRIADLLSLIDGKMYASDSIQKPVNMDMARENTLL